MDVRQLEYVVAVAEEGSFTRAARRCHVAESALSHQVARLETELGTKLFERTSRSVRISEAGRTLLPHAVQVLRDMADARAALDGLAGIIRGRLRIGMTQTASRTLDLISLIGEVHRQHPEITLTTATGPGSELIQRYRPVTSTSPWPPRPPKVPRRRSRSPPWSRRSWWRSFRGAIR